MRPPERRRGRCLPHGNPFHDPIPAAAYSMVRLQVFAPPRRPLSSTPVATSARHTSPVDATQLLATSFLSPSSSWRNASRSLFTPGRMRSASLVNLSSPCIPHHSVVRKQRPDGSALKGECKLWGQEAARRRTRGSSIQKVRSREAGRRGCHLFKLLRRTLRAIHHPRHFGISPRPRTGSKQCSRAMYAVSSTSARAIARQHARSTAAKVGAGRMGTGRVPVVS